MQSLWRPALLRRRLFNTSTSRSILTVADVLSIAQTRRRTNLYIQQNQSLFEAMRKMAENEVSGLVVINPEKKVVGMLRQKHIMEKIVAEGDIAWKKSIRSVTNPTRDIVYLSPTDTIDDCRAVMALSGRKQIPVLDAQRLLGVISIADLATLLYTQTTEQTSAKSEYLTNVMPRKGLPHDTHVVVDRATGSSEESSQSYYLEAVAYAIPHPNKQATGGEDAYFIGSKQSQHVTTTPQNVSCIGVADGVGSWFEENVDPSHFSRELMQAAYKKVIATDQIPLIEPLNVLKAAYGSVLERKIVGSTTACIVTLDQTLGELHAANLGDSGFVIVQDKQSDHEAAAQRGTLSGSFGRTVQNQVILTPAGRRKGAHVTFRSPQQLHYFNCPYQLGFTKDKASQYSMFESPSSASVLRVPVNEGDLIILATDGLFDNMEEKELLSVIAEDSDIAVMVKSLAERAYALSLDREKDSPFAVLAKENDILWSGGMKDDITIIAARVRLTEESVNA